ncbi:hypothetical protein [Kutzneria buriramensis]|uniref:Uncharacterized protein n=1 Tax=Kutzneria buriramensis TaxID=1045776 RepID=A0A3E0H030_9PSEU|nr:hypothetical protein [Kutzneria buriramensis]REH36217.1 hypothetical protein BCF44_11686 [Kutzneria buriramensis]
MSETQERRLRRLLALYPRDHRERHGEEMLGVLLDSSPGWRDAVDLVGGAIALHLRRLFGLDGQVRRRDVLSVVSLLGPIVILAGAAADVREAAWWLLHDNMEPLPTWYVPDAPAWGAWLVVAFLAFFGQRRAAAVSAWLALGAFVVVTPILSQGYLLRSAGAGYLVLGAFTAVALTWSPGPVHGRMLAGKWAVPLAFGGDALVLAAMVLHSMMFAWWLAFAAMALTAHLACRAVRDRRIGRRAALVLALPPVTFIVEAFAGPWAYGNPYLRDIAFYGLPTLIVLLGMGILRPVRRRQPS